MLAKLEVNRKMRTYDGSPNKKEGTQWSMRTPNATALTVPALQVFARVGAKSFSL
jgi:hypothetical protein